MVTQSASTTFTVMSTDFMEVIFERPSSRLLSLGGLALFTCPNGQGNIWFHWTSINNTLLFLDCSLCVCLTFHLYYQPHCAGTDISYMGPRKKHRLFNLKDQGLNSVPTLDSPCSYFLCKTGAVMVPLNEMVSENLLVPRLPIIASLFFFFAPTLMGFCAP